jgi:hypothetical protein
MLLLSIGLHHTGDGQTAGTERKREREREKERNVSFKF